MITSDVLEKMALLSEIRINEEDRDELITAFDEMIGFVDVLKNVDTEGVEPMVRVHDNSNIWRRDYMEDSDFQKDLLKCAPLTKGDYIEVPRTVDEG